MWEAKNKIAFMRADQEQNLKNIINKSAGCGEKLKDYFKCKRLF